MRVILTNDSLDWLRSHRIYFDLKGRDRLRPGGYLRFSSGLTLEPYTGFFGGNTLCAMGFMSYSVSSLPADLTVGRYCSIGHGVDVIIDHHPLDEVSTSLIREANGSIMARSFAEDRQSGLLPGGERARRPSPVIEHDVWIGAHASIMAGITIGTGAVVAANSIVTRDVAPYEIVAGNPARVIRSRFPDDVVEMLRQTEWWRYGFTDFGDLPIDQPAEFAEAFLKRKADLEPYAPALVDLGEMPTAS